MNRRRTTARTLTGSRIYERDGSFKYFAPEPFMCPKTGKVKKWHTLCKIEEGELAARNALDALLGRRQSSDGRGDFAIFFGQWKDKALADRSARSPKDPARAAVWQKGTLALASQLGIIEDGFADFNVSQIEPPDIAEFLDQWEGRRSAQSYRGHLVKFFAWAVRKGLTKANVAKDVTVAKPKKRDVLMTHQQYHAIQNALRAAKMPRDKRAGERVCCYMDLLYLLYQRGTDVRLLKWNDFADPTLPVKPSKTEHSSQREVAIPITDDIRAVLVRARAVSRMSSMYVISADKGQPYTAHGIESIFTRAAKRIGIEGVTLKDIRPMAATDASKAGYTEEQLKVALAHTDVSTTRDYIRSRQTPVSEVVLTLPKR